MDARNDRAGTPGRTRLLLDGYYLSSTRGMGRYARELVEALATAPDLDVSVAVQKGERYDLPAGVRRLEQPRLPFPLWEQIAMPLLIGSVKPDVYHAPSNTAPWLRAGAGLTVVTVHDLMFCDPAFKVHSLRQRIGRAYRQMFVPRRVSDSLKVTTETHEVIELLRRRFGYAAHLHRISIDVFLRVQDEPVDGLPDRYLLFVSGASYNKNSERTLAAFKAAALSDATLVVAGIGARHPTALKHESGNIRFPGWITDGQLLYLYRNAIAVLFPSLLEGYGLPVLEGMATSGVVVTSDRPPMNELADDACLLVNPEDIDAIAAAIRRVWTDEQLRSGLKLKAKRRMDAFSPDAMLTALRELYRGRAETIEANEISE